MAGEILAVQMTERAAAVHKVCVAKMRQSDGTVMTQTEVAGGMNFDLSGNVLLLQGEVTNGAPETETSVFTFQFTLPANYMAGGDITLRLKCANIGGGTQTSCTITATAYLSDGNGAVGGSLVTGGAQTHAVKTTWYAKDFSITASGLVAGDTLNVSVSVENVESASTNLIWTCDEVALLLDIQG